MSYTYGTSLAAETDLAGLSTGHGGLSLSGSETFLNALLVYSLKSCSAHFRDNYVLYLTLALSTSYHSQRKLGACYVY